MWMFQLGKNTFQTFVTQLKSMSAELQNLCFYFYYVFKKNWNMTFVPAKTDIDRILRRQKSIHIPNSIELFVFLWNCDSLI